MAGGTWVTQNKILPGFYLNFKSDQANLLVLGERGVVLMPLVADWGVSHQVIRTEASTDFATLTGYTIIDPEMLLIREALKRARYVDIYRLNSGTKASVVAGALKATALYGGTRGNDIVIVVEPNIEASGTWDVITMVSGAEVDSQTVTDVTELVANDWVVFAQEGASPTLTASAGAVLIGGANGTVTNQDHVDFMAVAETRTYNTLALTSVSDALKSIYTTFIKRIRDTIGFKTQLVLSNYAANHEGVINVASGYQLTDGSILTADQAVAWVAGATAGATVAQGLTYAQVEDAIDANPRMTATEQEAAIKAGKFVFIFSRDRALVLQDINSLTAVTVDKGKNFKKNKFIRVIDGLANDGQATFEDTFIGKVPNNADGRGLFRAQMVKLIIAYQDIGAVENFNSQTDITVAEGTDSDAIVWTVQGLKIVDMIEKMYGLFRVR